jgi:FKBP-type peptidyl-prolyl cis-trans isomerase FklB
MKKIILSLTVAIIAITASSQELKTRRDSISYAMGVSMAESLKKSGIKDINEKIFSEAILAHLKNLAIMDAGTADKLYREESKKLTQQAAQANKEAGQAFLKTNATKPGVKTTATGLQYKHTTEGKGVSPDANDKVTVHYHGTLIDGTIFDSSVDRGQPATFGLNQVIPGWTEGLQLMKEGGKTTFYIPSELAYKDRAQGKIGANSALIFEVELIKVEPVEGTAAPAPQPKPAVTPQPKK